MSVLTSWFTRETPAGLIVLSVLVGAAAAVGAALFHALLVTVVTLFYGTHGAEFVTAVGAMPDWQRVLIPTLGGLLVGIVFALARVEEAEGEGVPEVAEAIAERRGRIRPLVAPVKIVTAALTLGSGGSAGREGPVIQIGSAIGSAVAQFLSLATPSRQLLLAAGAAAAIGGTFGAPLAGIFFAVEILRQRLGVFPVMLIALAALIGTLGVQLLTGHEGLRFSVGDIPFVAVSTQLIIAVAVGVCAALVAVLFGGVLHSARLLFTVAPIPSLLRPAIGGFLVGCIGLYLPYIHEPAAYPLMVDLLALTALPTGLLLTILIVKMLATGLTIGSGGSGGIFAPTLLLGMIVGSILAGVASLFGLVGGGASVLFVALGMAAVFAAAAHAPLTAAVIAYEMTGELTLLLPLVVTCVTAFVVSRALHPKSMYETHM